MRIEEIILSNLLVDREYVKQVAPYLLPRYFHDKIDKMAFKLIRSYIAKYKKLPKEPLLLNEASEMKGLNDEEEKELLSFIKNLFSIQNLEESKEWLIDRTEEFCQDKAMYNSVMDSIQILEGNDQKKTKNAIPEMMKEALSVSFDKNLGHDYVDDSDARFEKYQEKDAKRIPFDLQELNDITKGGLKPKTLNVIMAGCVHPSTKIKVRIKKKS